MLSMRGLRDLWLVLNNSGTLAGSNVPPNQGPRFLQIGE